MGEEFECPVLDPLLVVVVERPEEAEGYMPPSKESDSVHYEVARTDFVVLQEEVGEVGAVSSPEIDEIEERGSDDRVAEIYDAGDTEGGRIEEDMFGGEIAMCEGVGQVAALRVIQE